MAAVINMRTATSSVAVSPEAARVLRNTYMLLAVSMLPAVAGAAVSLSYPPYAVLGFAGTLIAFLVAIFGLQAMVYRNRNSAAGIAWLFAFTGAFGYFLGDLLNAALSLRNGIEMIGMALGGTAVLFFVLAGYATVTQRNFATLNILKMLSIGILMAFVMMLVNAFFLQLPGLALALSVVFMIVSSGFIVFTVNAIVRGGETNYITATLTLFVMLYNIFSSLLHLLLFAGGRE